MTKLPAPMPPCAMQDGCLTHTALRSGDGIRAYLRHVLHFPSHTAAATLDEDITVNGAPPPPKYRLTEGDVLSIRLAERESGGVLPTSMPLHVLFEDDHVLLVNKPRGIPTHPSHGHYTDTLANGVAAWAEDRGLPFVFRPVNRLDKDTSGVLLIAKHRLSAARLAMTMAAGAVEKTYVALLSATPKEKEGEIALPIAREEGSVLRRTVKADGDEAVTRYRILAASPSGEALALVRPLTGRTHQIRVHFSAIGCPLLGDEFYGTPHPDFPGQALHARALRFPHPITGEPLSVTAPLPDAWRALIPTEGVFALTEAEKSDIIPL